MTTDWASHTDNDNNSVFQGNLPLVEKLERARVELLDLSARNRLLSMPRSGKSARTIEIVDEKSAEIFRLLVREGKPFTFVAGKSARTEDAEEDAEAYEITDLAQPDDDIVDDRGVFSRHVDTRLQTRLTPQGLQKRLLELYFDARTLEEEQGVNILYLTLGTLKWVDPANAANIRYAPLLLIPVSLDRGNAAEKFKLRVRQDDFASNLSLETFLERVHGICLPPFEAADSFEPISYFEGVADAVAAKPDWAVQTDDIALGFFSFAKFLMYRDLDPETWPAHARISDRPLIRCALADGFAGSDGMIPEDAKIDPFIPPSEMLHIVDSDSSQALAVHEVRRGRDMVIQGPPGTGKSQTIANIIAAAVADGKTVLFVAEKMAALEVVKRRLDATGVGDACLELHSNKANKRALLDELRRTWHLGAPKIQDAGTLYTRLAELRDGLNAHAARLHCCHTTAGLSAYQVIGQLVRLRQAGERPNDIVLETPGGWTVDGYAERHAVLAELAERVKEIGKPSEHVWSGVGLASITPMEVERFTGRFASLAERLEALDAKQADMATMLECERAATLDALLPSIETAVRIAGAPELSESALSSSAWQEEYDAICALLVNGKRYAQLKAELATVFTQAAWETDTGAACATLARLPHSFSLAAFGRLVTLVDRLPQLTTEAEALARAMGCPAPLALADILRLVKIGERVLAAPSSSREAFAADAWDGNTGRAADLAGAALTLEQVRSEIGTSISDAAWGMELSSMRTTLAAHGTGFFKIFSGEWRRSNRLVRSILVHPEQPLTAMLTQLDALARGQAAKRLLEAEDALGKSLFATDWRQDRSDSGPLLALVEWMQSVEGFGAEPRTVVAANPDRDVIARHVAGAQKFLAELVTIVAQTWSELPEPAVVFGETPTAERANLAQLLSAAVSFTGAASETEAILTTDPASLSDRLAMLQSLAEGQACAASLGAGDVLGSMAFGTRWAGKASAWHELEGAATWIAANGDIRLLASRVAGRGQLAVQANAIKAERATLIADTASLLEDMRLTSRPDYEVSQIGAVPIERLRVSLGEWAASGEQLFKWVAYRDRADRGRALGCGDVVMRLEDGRLTPGEVLPAFEMAYYEAIYAEMVRSDPDLGRFDGTLHGRIVRDFVDLDRQRIALAGVEVVQAHHKRVPPRDGSAIGPLGVLRAEMHKKRGHMPIRKLMERAGQAVQALKPVFMMSPLSVAQFLAPGVFDFDLLVMDEASQIQPVDALGAIARARQVVVVGDPKQLPPTAFFSKITGNGSEDDDSDGGRVADIESILGLFTARGLPTRMLRWHYRSKHQSLIAVSNRQFYEGKLFIVPSPYTAEAGMGLRFHYISEGLFDAGGTRTNKVEAKIVAQAIIEHARECPHLSLGVAAFSAAQRRAILDQLELMRRSLPPDTEAFFQAHPAEPFFVKNLENVQGDERDVIFISVGYGPITPGGRPPMRFGPLGSEGGERRLNVLISRAKQRCEVFSSMTDEDIEPDFAATRKGVLAFRLFLHYARTGRMTMAESTGRDHDSVFEEQVAKALQARGYQVHAQVGLAGFFIDLAVADAERPGRYLLGIECDGASYHDARSARDRDRLRQSVLESHGWVIHRVWSTDWFQRPAEQLELIIARIEAAKDEYDAKAASRSKRAVPIEIVTVEREGVTEIGLVPTDDASPSAGAEYVEAVLQRPSYRTDELHETPTGILTNLVVDAVSVEGPVHADEVVHRIRDAWGLKRAGGRIQDAVEAAVKVAVKTGRVERVAQFLSIPNQPVRIRDRSATRSINLRRADMLPPAEIDAAILDIARNNFGATRDQMVQATSRMLGIKVTSATVRAVIEQQIDEAVASGALVLQGDILTPAALS